MSLDVCSLTLEGTKSNRKIGIFSFTVTETEMETDTQI